MPTQLWPAFVLGYTACLWAREVRAHQKGSNSQKQMLAGGNEWGQLGPTGRFSASAGDNSALRQLDNLRPAAQESPHQLTIYPPLLGLTVMATSRDEDHDQLVARLTTGFGAMLEQVQELASKNTELEQRLARVREEVFYALCS